MLPDAACRCPPTPLLVASPTPSLVPSQAAVTATTASPPVVLVSPSPGRDLNSSPSHCQIPTPPCELPFSWPSHRSTASPRSPRSGRSLAAPVAPHQRASPPLLPAASPASSSRARRGPLVANGYVRQRLYARLGCPMRALATHLALPPAAPVPLLDAVQAAPVAAVDRRRAPGPRPRRARAPCWPLRGHDLAPQCRATTPPTPCCPVPSHGRTPVNRAR